MSWPIRALGAVAERVTVGHVGPTSQYYAEDGIPLLRTQNVGSQRLQTDDVKKITAEFHASLKKSQLKTGDVVISRVISSEIRCAQIPAEFDGANCANIIAVRPGPNLDPSYLVQYLTSPIVQSALMKRKVGSAQSVVNTAVLKAWKLPLPPLPEQKRIAAILDKADAIRRKRQQAIRLTEELLRSAFLDMFGDPVTNPKGWEVKKLGEVVSNFDARRVPLKAADRAERQGSVPYYGASGVIDYIDEHIFEGRYLLVGEDGANLVARSTPVAFQATGRFWVNNHAHVLQPKKPVTLEYLEHFFHRVDLVPYVTGSAQPKLNQKQLDRIPVPVPPSPLLDTFGNLVKSQSTMLSRLYGSRKNVGELATSLTQRAFSGKL